MRNRNIALIFLSITLVCLSIGAFHVHKAKEGIQIFERQVANDSFNTIKRKYFRELVEIQVKYGRQRIGVEIGSDEHRKIIAKQLYETVSLVENFTK